MAHGKAKSSPQRRPPRKRVKPQNLASERFKSKSRFYRGTDVETPFEATIRAWTTETIGDNGEEKDVVWLENHERGIVLNQTMGLQLSEDLGDDMDHWPGGEVRVYTERVRNPSTGKLGPAVRICGAKSADAEDDEVVEDDDEFEDDDLD